MSAGTPGPPRLRADRRRSGTGNPQVRGYRSEGTGEEAPESLLDDKACIFAAFAHTGAMSDLPVSVARSRLDEIVDDVRAAPLAGCTRITDEQLSNEVNS